MIPQKHNGKHNDARNQCNSNMKQHIDFYVGPALNHKAALSAVQRIAQTGIVALRTNTGNHGSTYVAITPRQKLCHPHQFLPKTNMLRGGDSAGAGIRSIRTGGKGATVHMEFTDKG